MKGKKNIWVISEIYYPVDVSTGYYITEIAESLAKEDFTVNVLTSTSTYGVITKKIKSEELWKNVYIKRVNTLFTKNNKTIKRVINAFYVSLRLSIKLLANSKKGDKVLAVTNPFFLILFLPLICLIKELDYTLLVHDIFPENLFAIKDKKRKGLLDLLLLKLFNKAYSKPNRCIAIGRDMVSILEEKGAKNIHFIPIWSQDKEILPINKKKTIFLKESNLCNSFIFQFAGNLGLAQGIESLLMAIDELEDNVAHFLFIGAGALYDTIQKKESNKISIYGYQKRCAQHDFLNACDVSIVSLSDGMLGLGVPSKTYNILAAGKPILFLGSKKSEVALLIKEHNIGWVVESKNSEDIKSVIKNIVSFPDSKLKDMGKRARYLAETIYSKENILERYNTLLL